MTHRKRIGVLRGGPSNEYEVSLKTGAAVLETLQKHFEDRYHAKDIFVDKKGNWHVDGIEMKLDSALRSVDTIFNALHGSYGEDGKVQSILEHHGKPFTGSGSLASAIGMNKILAKKMFQNHKLKTPLFLEFRSDRIQSEIDKIVAEVFNTFTMPAVVKPASSGSSVGISVVKYYDGLPVALREAAKHDDLVMIEEFIPGIEATCAVVEGFRGQDLYALPPVEIRPGNEFFDYAAKYEGLSQEIVPATFASKTKLAIEDLARQIHRALGLKHYSRSDFIIHPRRGIYILEVNTLPGLTNESLLPKALRAVGSDLNEFVGHVIELSLGSGQKYSY
ncbi:MAG: D-alanine--D-alanine ligase [Candidatus Taylorbacteria bacterium]